jgi:ABC-type lipoprotein export system ATPase subunit
MNESNPEPLAAGAGADVASGPSRWLLEACNLHKTYVIGRRTLEVLQGVDLTVHEGEFAALRGASGAGKSTLLHLLGGLDIPNQGEIQFDGRPLSHLSALELARWRNRKIGFIFQAYHLFPELDALENVCLPARMARLSAGVAERRGRDLLARVGLGQRMDHKPMELSGGEQQRVALARALINEPRVLLLDEPLAGMGPHESQRMVELIKSLTADHAIMLIEHDMDAVFALAHRLTVMVNGEVLESGTPAEVRSSPAVQLAYLGGEELLHD